MNLFTVTLLLLPLIQAHINNTTYEKDKCLGPPYLYVTVHHRIPNVLKYSRDGCLLSETVLKGGHIHTPEQPLNTEFRSMMIGQYKDKEALYMGLATTQDSAVMVYGECDKNGQRTYLETVVDTKHNGGADHTYGLTSDQEGNIYASFQKTDVVLRFVKETFEPMPFPVHLVAPYQKHSSIYYPGTFYQFGSVGQHKKKEQGVRAIVYVNSDVWIANEDFNGIAVVDAITGKISNVITIHNPIGLAFDKKSNKVFVSSKKHPWKGAVFAINPDTMKVTDKYTNGWMSHPSGCVIDGDDLYVNELDHKQLIKFSVSTGKYLGLVTEISGQPEQVVLSSC